MSRWLLNYRLGEFFPVRTVPALHVGLSVLSRPSLGTGLKPLRRPQHGGVCSGTSCLASCLHSQNRSLSRSTKPSSRSSKATFVDLYAGIGGFHLGLAANGLRCVWANEYSRHAAETYERNHCKDRDGHGSSEGITSVDQRSIRDVISAHMDDIPDHTVLAGGIPCQPFSTAGKKQGFECQNHGDHLYRVGEIVAAKRPAVVLLENVRNFASTFKGVEVARRMLEEHGYWLSHRIYNAVDFNLAQSRKRVLMVAVRKDAAAGEPFELPDPPGRRPGLCVAECLLPPAEAQQPEVAFRKRRPTEFEEVVGGVVVPVLKSGKKASLVWADPHAAPDSIPPTNGGLIQAGGWEDPSGRFRRIAADRILHPAGLAACLKSSNPDWFLAPGWPPGTAAVRHLYRRELARLQGFPDSFVLPDSPNLTRKLLGNAVPPPMIYWVVRALKARYPDILGGPPSSEQPPPPWLKAKL